MTLLSSRSKESPGVAEWVFIGVTTLYVLSRAQVLRGKRLLRLIGYTRTLLG